MLRVGNFVVLVMPGELTTMAGRRMRYVCLFPGVHGYLIPALFIHPNQFPIFASEHQ